MKKANEVIAVINSVDIVIKFATVRVFSMIEV